MVISFKKIIFAGTTIFISIILLEILAFIGLQINELNNPVLTDIQKELYARNGIDVHERYKNMKSTHQDLVTLEPYRGYELPKKFRGSYISTDEYGFRCDISQQYYDQSKKIGFFGGSTTFGVTSDVKDSIPCLVAKALKPKLAQTHDFGVGAYSTSNELMTFVEVSRLKHYNIKYAIFYDGINELARYMEKLQDHQSNPFYEVIGYPYVTSLRPAAKNFINSKGEPKIQYQLALVQVWKKLESKMNRGRNINYILSDDDIESHIEIIYQIYVNNILDIDAIAKSRGIQAIFLWQPTLLSIKDREFTDNEKIILKAEPIAKKLSDALNSRIRRSNDFRDIKFFDLSGKFDELNKEEHFYDYCHVDETANRLISASIIEVLKQFLPADHFQPVSGKDDK